jgi:hypothetical protein
MDWSRFDEVDFAVPALPVRRYLAGDDLRIAWVIVAVGLVLMLIGRRCRLPGLRPTRSHRVRSAAPGRMGHDICRGKNQRCAGPGGCDNRLAGAIWTSRCSE